MEGFVVLAGPTMEQALGLVRIGLLSARPVSTDTCPQDAWSCSVRLLAQLCETAPPELKPLITPGGPNPVHLYVPSKNDVHEGPVKQHVLSQALPEGSLLELSEGVFVPSWALFFIIRCRDTLCLSALLTLGMELCGSYSHLIPGDSSTMTFYRLASRTDQDELVSRWNSPKVAPALSVASLEAYVARASGLRGIRQARKALRYLLDGAASPGESVLALMATLPCNMGGYGFEELELNPEIRVAGDKRHLTRFDAYHPDGYIKRIETDLEYESDQFHASKEAVARDKARRNDIQALGIEVKDVTREMVSHLDSLDLLFEQLLDKEHRMGFDPKRRHARAVRNPDNRARRRTRLQELLPPWPYEA